MVSRLLASHIGKKRNGHWELGLVWFGMIGVEKEWNLSSVNRILLNGMFVCLVECRLGETGIIGVEIRDLTRLL